MNQCLWIPWTEGAPTPEPGWWICSECGRPRSVTVRDPEWKGSNRPCKRRTSPQKRPPRPGLAARAANLRHAYARWQAAGKPVRTPERKAELFAICESNQCGAYNGLPLGLGGECLMCGCGLHRERKLANKLDWATEGCPAGLFPADV